jgi:transcriptional regulator with XRE-family HTH domain
MAEYSVVGSSSRDKLEKMVKDAGYVSMREFARDVGINISNIYSNLNGRWDISIKRMFKIANTLNVPILQVIEVFYPEELSDNMGRF